MLSKEETAKRINKMYNTNQGMVDHDLHLNWNEQQLKELYSFYQNGVMWPDIDFSGKIIVDYGCGGGWLGKFLFEKTAIKKYIGVDVAERSIAFAKNNLPKTKTKVQLIKIEPWDQLIFLKRKKIDILVSVACIQHFPTQEYLLIWLAELNSLKLEWIILQFHFHSASGGKTVFREDPYNSIRDVAYACYTTKEYIAKILTNYELVGNKQNIGKLERDFAYFKRRTNV